MLGVGGDRLSCKAYNDIVNAVGNQRPTVAIIAAQKALFDERQEGAQE